jgi:hypothetical protein
MNRTRVSDRNVGKRRLDPSVAKASEGDQRGAFRERGPGARHLLAQYRPNSTRYPPSMSDKPSFQRALAVRLAM